MQSPGISQPYPAVEQDFRQLTSTHTVLPLPIHCIPSGLLFSRGHWFRLLLSDTSSVQDLPDDQQLVFLLPFAHAATRLRLCGMFFSQEVIDIYGSDIADHLDMEKRQEINLHQYMSPDC